MNRDNMFMAKKNVQRARSAYQTHCSILYPSQDKIVDFTEQKLIRIATIHPNEDMRKLAARILVDYTSGKIAVAWDNGEIPVYCFLKQ